MIGNKSDKREGDYLLEATFKDWLFISGTTASVLAGLSNPVSVSHLSPAGILRHDLVCLIPQHVCYPCSE